MSSAAIGQAVPLDGEGARLIISVNETRAVGAASARASLDLTDTIKLSQARRGDRGVIVQVGGHCHHKDHEVELERRLLELGFVEGARIELLHEGLFGRDPIAMKVDDMRVALRRHEAASLTIKLDVA
jgi:ferrous iron transport protein A